MSLADRALPAPAFFPVTERAPARERAAPVRVRAPRSAGPGRPRPMRLRRRTRGLALALVMAAHAAGLYAIARADFSPALVAAAPLQVALIKAAQPAPPPEVPPAPVPPPEPVVKPKPVPVAKPKPRPAPPPPKPVSKAPTALTAETPPEPEPPAAAAPAEPAPPAPPAPAAAPAAASRAAPGPSTPVVTAARFDADYLNNPPPAYPPLSRRMREEGRVMLRVRVSAEGLPAEIELSASSGSGRLDRAATDAVRRWRFVPARQGDRALAAWVLVPIVFKLEGS